MLCRPVMNGGYGFTLEYTDSLTYTEIDFYLEILDPAPVQPQGGVTMGSPEQAQAYAQWYRSLTPLERIEMAMNKRV